MTAGRQERKSRLRRTLPKRAPGLLLGIALLGGLCAGIYAPNTGNAATTERIVVDRRTGLAIGGFDPVAYFTDAAPKIGKAEIEYGFAGATWRFRNEGNRAAFAEDPDVYMPRFGGYDPVAVARGVSVPGHPLFWLIAGERLYFFYSAQARSAFVAEPERIVAAAERKWSEVRRALTP